MKDAASAIVVELVEKMGLLRRELEHHQQEARYAARLARIGQKVAALADAMADDDPGRAAALRTAWERPARSLAFRNAAHQKDESS